jgi:hypothetical protein
MLDGKKIAKNGRAPRVTKRVTRVLQKKVEEHLEIPYWPAFCSARKRLTLFQKICVTNLKEERKKRLKSIDGGKA